MTTHLVIGDQHAKPGISNERFTWLGRLIRDIKPDVVINMGDMADMPSLSSYDVGKKSFEGRRYKNDIAAVHDALSKIKTAGGKPYDLSRKIITLGNHEDRINRAVEADAKLEGLISIDDLKYKDYNWEVFPYQRPVNIDGILYSHTFVSGIMRRPVGGEHAANSLLKTQFQSCTAAHSHLFDFSCRTKPDGTKIYGLVAGCYFTHNESFAGPCNALYSRGIVVKRRVKNGSYDHEWISIEAIKQEYSK